MRGLKQDVPSDLCAVLHDMGRADAGIETVVTRLFDDELRIWATRMRGLKYRSCSFHLCRHNDMGHAHARIETCVLAYAYLANMLHFARIRGLKRQKPRLAVIADKGANCTDVRIETYRLL